MRVATPNDPMLSDGGVRRGTCMVGGKAAAEAGAVTHGAVRCSAWLGVAVVVSWGRSIERALVRSRSLAVVIPSNEEDNCAAQIKQCACPSRFKRYNTGSSAEKDDEKIRKNVKNACGSPLSGWHVFADLKPGLSPTNKCKAAEKDDEWQNETHWLSFMSDASDA